MLGGGGGRAELYSPRGFMDSFGGGGGGGNMMQVMLSGPNKCLSSVQLLLSRETLQFIRQLYRGPSGMAIIYWISPIETATAHIVDAVPEVFA